MAHEALMRSLLFSLAATLVLEEIVALLWRVKAKDQIRIALANCITNPVVVFLFIVLVSVIGANRIVVSCVLEVCAVAAEALIYKLSSEIKRPILFAVVANTVSYFTGLIITSLF